MLTKDLFLRSSPLFSSLNWFDRSTFFSSDQTAVEFNVRCWNIRSIVHALLQAMNMNNCWSIRHTDDKCLFACLVEQMDRMQLDQLLWCTAFFFSIDPIDIITSSCPARLLRLLLLLSRPLSSLYSINTGFLSPRDFRGQSNACCF